MGLGFGRAAVVSSNLRTKLFLIFVLILGLAMLASCGGGSNSGANGNGNNGGTGGNAGGNGSGGGNGGGSSAALGFVYVANTGSNNVTGLSVNPQSAAVAPVAGSPFAVPTFPVSIAESGNFVFVSSSGDQFGTDPSTYRITTYAIDANTGALTPGSSLSYPATVGAGAPVELKVDPTGKFLYVVLGGAGGFASFSIDPASGALTELPGSPMQPTGFGVLRHPVITPDGRFMYMTGDIGPRAPEYVIAQFSRDATAGTINSNFAQFAADGLVQSMAITPDGHFLLAAVPSRPVNSGGSLGPLDAVSVYAIGSDGVLTKVANEPFTVGANPQSVAVDPSGKFAFVANHDSNNVSVLSIGADGALTNVAGSPFTSATGPVAIAVSTSGKYVFVANAGSNDVSGYSFDAGSGALTPLTGSPFAAGNAPVGVVAAKF